MQDEREYTMERIADIREQLDSRIMQANKEIQELGGLDFHVEGVDGRFLTLSARPVGAETAITYWTFIDVCRFDLPPAWTTPSKVDAFVLGDPASSGPGQWSSDPEVSVIQVRGVPHGSCSGDTFSIVARLCGTWSLLEDFGNPQVQRGTTAYARGRLKTCIELLQAGVVDVCMPRHGFGARDRDDERGLCAEARRLGLHTRSVPFEYQLRFPDASIVASPERTTWQVILYLPEAAAKADELERLLREEGPGIADRWRRVGALLGYSESYVAARLEALGEATTRG